MRVVDFVEFDARRKLGGRRAEMVLQRDENRRFAGPAAAGFENAVAAGEFQVEQLLQLGAKLVEVLLLDQHDGAIFRQCR